MNIQKAFTLSEVLITLGIIGIVAAMTLPILVQNYKKQETSARVKKFYSMMSQAILMSEIDNGPAKNWAKVEMVWDNDGNENIQENRKLAANYFNQYLKPYIKYTKIDENPIDPNREDGQSGSIKIYFADGSIMNFRNGACAHIMYDINGNKLPNESGKDGFDFLICPASRTGSEFGNANITFAPWCPNCNTREEAKSACIKNAHLCSKLLMIDNWEFKDDYPHRL